MDNYRELILEKTTEYITAVMASAATTTNPDVTVIYEEKEGKVEATARVKPKSNTTTLNGTTAVTVVSAPANANVIHRVKNIIVENRDTASVHFYIKMVDSGGTRILYDVTLRSGYTWDFSGVKDSTGAVVITHELDAETTTADIDPSTDRNYVTDSQLAVIENTSGTNTGDQVVPASTSATSNQFFTAYNGSTGAFTKARPTWANVDKTTSDVADLTTKSHTSLTDIGTNTHAQIDTALDRLVSTSGTNTGDQDLSGYVPDTRTVNGEALSGNVTLTTANIEGSTNRRYVQDADLTVISNTSGTNTGDQDLSGYVPTSRTVNSQALSGNITLTTANVEESTNRKYVQDADLTVISNTSGTNTGDQDLSGYVPTSRTVNAQALTGNITLTTANIEGSTNRRYVQDADLTVISNTSGTNTGDQDLTVLIPKSIGTGKGVLIGFSADSTPIVIASATANGMYLASDDTEPAGVKWVTP